MMDFFRDQIIDLKGRNLYRDQELINNQILSSETYINFSSNDYLGLAESTLSDLSVSEIAAIPLGSGGSRLTTGSHLEHCELERLISKWKGTEDTIIFSSGYLANLGALSALANKADVVFIDEFAHACMWDALRITGVRKYIFSHNDAVELKSLLQRYRHKYKNSFILTESVFSMDGDFCQMAALKNLGDEYESFLYVDEAHSTGLFGDQGAGLVAEYEKKAASIIQMGTMSKAIGLEGAYVSGSKLLVDYLRNKARTYVYSTAASPLLVKFAEKNIRKIMAGDELREKLFSNIQYFYSLMQKLKPCNEMKEGDSFWWTNFGAPIFTVQFKNLVECLSVSEKLFQSKFLCTAIRPPTVKTPRLRICVSSKHRQEELLSFFDTLSIALRA